MTVDFTSFGSLEVPTTGRIVLTAWGLSKPITALPAAAMRGPPPSVTTAHASRRTYGAQRQRLRHRVAGDSAQACAEPVPPSPAAGPWPRHHRELGALTLETRDQPGKGRAVQTVPLRINTAIHGNLFRALPSYTSCPADDAVK